MRHVLIVLLDDGGLKPTLAGSRCFDGASRCARERAQNGCARDGLSPLSILFSTKGKKYIYIFENILVAHMENNLMQGQSEV